MSSEANPIETATLTELIESVQFRSDGDGHTIDMLAKEVIKLREEIASIKPLEEEIIRSILRDRAFRKAGKECWRSDRQQWEITEEWIELCLPKAERDAIKEALRAQ